MERPVRGPAKAFDETSPCGGIINADLYHVVRRAVRNLVEAPRQLTPDALRVSTKLFAPFVEIYGF